MATTSEASRLQSKVNGMRSTWMTVGLLAMLSFSACGVGVDDPEGQLAADGQAGDKAAGQNQQSLVTGPEGCPTGPGSDSVPEVGSNGEVNPTISNLPTDPIPWEQPRNDDEPIPGPGGMPPAPYSGNR